ncbi:hypothetical protein ABBQ38_006398 [Trebouxia sp. C0009 RCD-2024]
MRSINRIPATTTPSREMQEPLRPFEDMEATPKADAQQVASLQTHNVCIKEHLKSLSDKNQELAADRQKLYEQNNMLIKCVAELSAVCKRKEATLGELRHCIQTADKLTDTLLPPVEQKASNPMQQSRVTQPEPARCASSQTGLRMPCFDFEGIPHCPQGPSAGARQALMIKAAKQHDGFNAKHVSDIVRMTQQMPCVQRTAGELSFFRSTPESRHSEGMQEVLGEGFDYKAEGSQNQRLGLSFDGSLGGAITHGPQTCAHEQILEVSTGGFCGCLCNIWMNPWLGQH